MKCKTNRQELLSAAKKAATVVPSISPLEVLKCILMETDTGKGTLTLTATNLEVSLEQSIPTSVCEGENVSLAIEAKLLVAMLTQLDGDDVELTQDNPAQITLRGGNALYCVPVLAGKEYPHVQFPTPDNTIKVSEIPKMVQRTAFATVDSETTPLFKCVNVKFTSEGLRAVSSDGSCAISARGDQQSTGEASLLVPAPSLEKLARMCSDKDAFDVGIGDRSIVFRKENFAYSARLMAGSYINTDQIFNSLKNSFTVLSDAMELRSALESVSALTRDNRVKLTFSGNSLLLSCCSDFGNSKTSVGVIPLSGNPCGEFFFMVDRLSQSLRAMGGTITVGIAQGGALTLSSEDAQYMQVAMRATAAKKSRKAKSEKKAA